MRSQIVVLSWCFALGVHAFSGGACLAYDMDGPPRHSLPMRTEIRSAGVLEESRAYHRQPAMPAGSQVRTITPSNGCYRYGFPVQTFRWGWFGAAHYYPRVMWHDGYYGDCCRYAYRCGY